MIYDVVDGVFCLYSIILVFSLHQFKVIASIFPIFDPCWIILVVVIYVFVISLCPHVVDWFNYFKRNLCFCCCSLRVTCSYKMVLDRKYGFLLSLGLILEVLGYIFKKGYLSVCIFWHTSFTPEQSRSLISTSCVSTNVWCLITKCPIYVEAIVEFFKHTFMSPLIRREKLQLLLLLAEKVYFCDVTCAKAYTILGFVWQDTSVLCVGHYCRLQSWRVFNITISLTIVPCVEKWRRAFRG